MIDAGRIVETASAEEREHQFADTRPRAHRTAIDPKRHDEGVSGNVRIIDQSQHIPSLYDHDHRVPAGWPAQARHRWFLFRGRRARPLPARIAGPRRCGRTPRSASRESAGGSPSEGGAGELVVGAGLGRELDGAGGVAGRRARARAARGAARRAGASSAEVAILTARSRGSSVASRRSPGSSRATCLCSPPARPSAVQGPLPRIPGAAADLAPATTGSPAKLLLVVAGALVLLAVYLAR